MKVTLKPTHAGTWMVYSWSSDELKKRRLSLTKLLGGKDNVKISRWWTHHGGGGWMIDYFIKDVNLAVSTANSYGCMVELDVTDLKKEKKHG